MSEIKQEFYDELERRTHAAQDAAERYLPEFPAYWGNLCEAMCYSVLAGGKRLRPMMLGYTCEAFGGNITEAEPFMAAMEYIHTASLIHDDLPAIDNDELRRGKPTVHKAFGEETGILAGDALLNYAYETIFQGIPICENPKNATKAAWIIASKSGLYGMLGGQGLDVGTEKGKHELGSREMLDVIYQMKTSALIEASLMAGAALAGAGDETLDLLEQIGRDVGMAFQIRDDILDVTESTEDLGKPSHSDEKNLKKTYVSFSGIEGAQKSAKELTERAMENAKKLPCDASFLMDLILYLCDRKK